MLLSQTIRCQAEAGVLGFFFRAEESFSHILIQHDLVIVPARGINAKVFDTALWRELQREVNDSIRMRQYAEEWLEAQQRNNDNQTDVANIHGLLANVQDEENRYVTALGKGILDEQQFNQVIQDVRTRKVSLQKQLKELSQKKIEKPEDVDVDELVAEAKQVVEGLDWDNKIATVRDIIDRIVIREQTGVEVFVQLPMLQTQKLEYEFENRDRRITKRRQKHAV